MWELFEMVTNVEGNEIVQVSNICYCSYLIFEFRVQIGHDVGAF